MALFLALKCCSNSNESIKHEPESIVTISIQASTAEYHAELLNWNDKPVLSDREFDYQAVEITFQLMPMFDVYSRRVLIKRIIEIGCRVGCD